MKAKSGEINFEWDNWKDEASIIKKIFLSIFKSSIGVPIFPPSKTLYPFSLRTCANILHVVDFPLVPVITALLKFGFDKKIKSRSVMIFFFVFN